MPFLALSPQLAERLELGLDQAQIREAVNGYLKIIPEFMNGDGALSYYRGGQYSSDYLTAYVLWALHLARERDYKVDPQLVQKLSAYLQRASLDKTCESFYQFVLSLDKKADNKKLKKLAAERDGLPLPARVFLYRALHNQGIEARLLKTMLDEFNNSLQVEADFAYFDVGEFTYHRDFPVLLLALRHRPAAAGRPRSGARPRAGRAHHQLAPRRPSPTAGTPPRPISGSSAPWTSTCGRWKRRRRARPRSSCWAKRPARSSPTAATCCRCKKRLDGHKQTDRGAGHGRPARLRHQRVDLEAGQGREEEPRHRHPAQRLQRERGDGRTVSSAGRSTWWSC